MPAATSSAVDRDASNLTAKQDFLRELVHFRLLIETGVQGVFGRSAVFEDIVSGLHGLIDPISREQGAERLSFPPVVPREVLRRTGYMENFPQLCGSVHSFLGDDRDHARLLERVKAGGEWSDFLKQTEVVLTPAVCYPLYPTLTGTLPEGGRLFDLTSYCFRHEPSDDPARMQAFRMRENVCVGSAEQVRSWRTSWMERGEGMLAALGLPVRLAVAADPFFGRGGRMMKSNQKELELKFELLVPIWSEEDPTAVASFNYHQDHFGHTFDIRTSDGEPAHTACLGFGLERITLALLKTHGLDPSLWPEEVRGRLRL